MRRLAKDNFPTSSFNVVAPNLNYFLPSATTFVATCTFKFLLIAEKIAAMLSILGLPRSDSMRCKLLDGVPIARESPSKPIVALTSSRSIMRAVSLSPERKRLTASSSSARANSGSWLARSTTVCLESRVNAISHLPPANRTTSCTDLIRQQEDTPVQ